ncbi:RNA polymerase sigma factor [Parabacteroides sp. 52]|uniref:RNA polymerase sigma factor n=1 Tax=unclassified Parabacteroides TaxID=2649774 RepID=UPI0013D6DD67|nr:RNA polymerase sigma factor [Parabacteroides sp. PM5-20]MDH6534759.1 RNA polymerase sigma-70 factor (ECF subfamily) [Parabacteroides sp. PM5-20]NDV55765.1 RNA polymerase sigma factor [Parabacteroides sp. 52]
MNADSFKETFLPLHPKLYRVALALVGNKDDAEDILQDAYAKLWEKRRELTTIHNPEAFSVTLIKNLCLDFLRSPRSRRQTENLETVTLANYLTPDKELEGTDEIDRIKQLIEQLPENQKQVLKLRGFGDCSMEEIEEITGFTAVNVRTLLSRARKMIREQYIKPSVYER